MDCVMTARSSPSKLPFQKSTCLGMNCSPSSCVTSRNANRQKNRSSASSSVNALRMIDIAISSSFDLQIILDVVLQQVLTQLGVDAGAITLFNPQMQTIEYAAGRGFHSNALQHTTVKAGRRNMRVRPCSKRKTMHISGVMETGGKLAKALKLSNQEFSDY